MSGPARPGAGIGGTLSVLAGLTMLALTLPGGGTVTRLAAACGGIAVLTALRWPVTAGLALPAAVVALISQAPGPLQAAAVGLLAVLYLLCVHAGPDSQPGATLSEWLLVRTGVLLGATVAAAAALLGWLLPVRGGWAGPVAAVAAAVAFGLAVLVHRERAGRGTGR